MRSLGKIRFGVGVALFSSACLGEPSLDPQARSAERAAVAEDEERALLPFEEVTAACSDFCQAVAPKDCYEPDECPARCMAMYTTRCTAEVEALLACAPEWLGDACQVGFGDDEADDCSAELYELDTCGLSSSQCRNDEARLVGEAGCTGDGECASQPFRIDCDDEADCACSLGGVEVGRCAMPVAGTEACLSEVSCCRAFFDG